MNLQTAFSTFTQLQQDQGNGAALFVADQGQILGFQPSCCAAADQLGQLFGLVDEKKVSAVPQGFGCGLKKLVGAAQVIPPGDGSGEIRGAAG